MRLNAIAAYRAAANATTTQTSALTLTGCSALANTTPTSANGSANTVCATFTRLAYLANALSPATVCPSRPTAVLTRSTRRAEARQQLFQGLGRPLERDRSLAKPIGPQLLLSGRGGDFAGRRRGAIGRLHHDAGSQSQLADESLLPLRGRHNGLGKRQRPTRFLLDAAEYADRFLHDAVALGDRFLHALNLSRCFVAARRHRFEQLLDARERRRALERQLAHLFRDDREAAA